MPVVSRLSAFLPSFTEAVLVLLIGSLFSYFVFSAASIFGKFSRFPLTNLLASTLAISVILFTLYQTLLVLRINEEIIRFLIIGIIAAFSLVVGLSGKEIITDYAKRIKKL